MSKNDPQTYWEKRCNLLDQVVTRLMAIIGSDVSVERRQALLDEVFTAWNDALDKLNKEYDE